MEKTEKIAEIEGEAEMKSLTKLAHDWVMWEDVKSVTKKMVKGQKADAYLKELRKVAEFADLISFWQLWNNIPHNDPTNFFTVEDESTLKLKVSQYLFKRFNSIMPQSESSDPTRVVAIAIFQKGIEPLWEDPHNVNGGDIYVTRKNDLKEDSKKYWDKLVLLVIGGTFPYAENVTSYNNYR